MCFQFWLRLITRVWLIGMVLGLVESGFRVWLKMMMFDVEPRIGFEDDDDIESNLFS